MNGIEILLVQQLLYSQRLQKADGGIRFREMPTRTPKRGFRIRAFVGNLLINSGQKVKGVGPVNWAGA